MGNCAKLKWNRKAKGMTQKQFADLVGLSVGTIARLETDESAWLTVQPSTEEKIYAQYTSMHAWQPDRERVDKVMREIKGTSKTEEEETVNLDEVKKDNEKVWPNCFKTSETEKKTIDKRDEKTLTLLTTIWGWLNDSKAHEEFAENINMMKCIIDQY